MDAGRIRVLYSFPHKIGAGRICDTAWHQVEAVQAAGASMTVMPGAVSRPLPPGTEVRPTLSRGSVRLPYRVFGQRRTCAIHDAVVASRLERLADRIDIIHCWPLGSRKTLERAESLGIPTVLERPNAHTRLAYELVRREAERIGVPLTPGAEHAFNHEILRIEEREFQTAFRLLCPSEFVARSFEDAGYPQEKLLRTGRGFDPLRFYDQRPQHEDRTFTVLFAGYAAVRKGLHLALDAWLASPAHDNGRFLIAGEILPAYRSYLEESIRHPSVHELGHRDDLPALMREADGLLLPSVEEGFGRVAIEAMASGAVPLVSTACTDACVHGRNALVHEVGDVASLSRHITELHEDKSRREQLRVGALASSKSLTWEHAGQSLLRAYHEALKSHS